MRTNNLFCKQMCQSLYDGKPTDGINCVLLSSLLIIIMRGSMHFNYVLKELTLITVSKSKHGRDMAIRR